MSIVHGKGGVRLTDSKTGAFFELRETDEYPTRSIAELRFVDREGVEKVHGGLSIKELKALRRTINRLVGDV